MDKRIGNWAFIAGVIIAIIAGLVPAWNTPTVMWILVVLGLIVGLLNITAKETVEFLVATIALVVIGTAGTQAIFQTLLGNIVPQILGNVVAFVAPAGLIVALKSVYALAQK